ncbi:uncharacterized protein JCM6883_003874 [Sporobolomyces salmoneus]|uniref:uncharacterized protein n=1 Tax=Sporobolomyces salmoneus TaxID=183962 RepID=UPI00317E6627
MADSTSSTSLSPSRLFDRLPTETLSQIFEDVSKEALSTEHTRKAHYKILRSLCLVSKLFRSFAQPLLLKHVSLAMGSGPKVLERLLSNNSKEAIATIENFYYDEKLTNLIPSLKKFIKLASNLEQAYVDNRQLPPLKAFLGSNITTLSLKDIMMTLKGAVFSLPQLVRLSMVTCPIHNEGGIRFELPKLKHLAWFGYSSFLYPQEFDFIDRLAPQLDSFTTQLINKAALPPSIFSLPSLSVLIEFYPTHTRIENLDGIRHLYFDLSGALLFGGFWARLIGSSEQRQLETVTLERLRKDDLTPSCILKIKDFVKFCEENGIEVIWQERVDGHTFYDLVPASFIRRAESRHQDRNEVQSSKQGAEIRKVDRDKRGRDVADSASFAFFRSVRIYYFC